MPGESKNFTITQDQYEESPSKRRRITISNGVSSSISVSSFSDTFPEQRSQTDSVDATNEACQEVEHAAVSMSASSKHAGQTVAPFLARHIPDQYAPMGKAKRTDPNTKYCYRHHPDLKCQRQANEPSMDQLQHVSAYFAGSYDWCIDLYKELEDLSQGDQQAITHVWSLFSAAPAKHRQLMLNGILTQCCFPQLSFLSANVRELIRIDFLTALPPEISYKVLCFLDTTSLCKAAQVSQRWRSLADDDVVWHRMCEQHIDRKCTKCGWGLPLLERKRLRASKRQIQLRATGRGLNEWSPDIEPYPETAQEALKHDPLDFIVDSPTHDYVDSLPSTLTEKLMVPYTKQPLSTSKLTDADDSYFQPRTRPWKEVYKDRFRVGTNWKHGILTLYRVPATHLLTHFQAAAQLKSSRVTRTE